MLRKDLERQFAELEPPPDPAGLRGRLAAAIEEEKRLTAESQREQMQVDAFRTRKEVLKAVYTAAEAEHLIEQAQGIGDDAVRPDDPGGAAARLDEIIGLRHMTARIRTCRVRRGYGTDDITERQAGYWSWRAHTSIQSSSVSLRPDERISASSWKYSSRGGPGANRMSIRADAPLSLEKA